MSAKSSKQPGANHFQGAIHGKPMYASKPSTLVGSAPSSSARLRMVLPF